MPIIYAHGSKQLHFGSGDINVAYGLLDMEEVVGVVAFRQQEPQEIGSHTKYGPGHTVEAHETPIRMTFDKLESIDVVIQALEEAKKLMIEKMALQ